MRVTVSTNTRRTVRQRFGAAQRLRDAERGSAEIAKRRSFFIQTINFRPDRRRQRRVGCFSAK
jgi:hypothetical protein